MASPLGTITDPVMPTLVGSAIVVYTQRYLKSFPWYRVWVDNFPLADKYVHRIVAGVGSLITTLGISIAFTGDWNVGWHFEGTIPPATALALGVWAWIKLYVLQQMIYDMTKQGPSPVAVVVASSDPKGGKL
jgi:hypothetical protein